MHTMRELWRVRRQLTCIHWIGPGETWAADLRGAPVFRYLRRTYRLLRMFGAHARVTIVGSKPVQATIGRNDVVIIYMPSTSSHLDLIHECRRAGARVIADVTADVLSLAAPTVASRTAWTEGTTGEAAEFWHRPDVLYRYGESLQAAHAVMTSWEYLVDPLTEWLISGIPVVHVPDWTPENEEPFIHGLFNVIAAARGVTR